MSSSWCCVKLSGIEPKVKFYMGVKGNGLKEANAKLENFVKNMLKIISG